MSGRVVPRVVVPLRATEETLVAGRWVDQVRSEVEADERHARRRAACLTRTRCRFALAKDRVARWFEGFDAAMRVLHGVERSDRG